MLGRIDLPTWPAASPSAAPALLESARATLVQAERTHASNERLAAQQFISPIALENSRAAVDTARANAERHAGSRCRPPRVSLRDGTLLAPICRHRQPSATWCPARRSAAEQQVLTIVDLRGWNWPAAVGTHEVSRLAPGLAVQVQVEGVAQPVAGRIARIAPAAEPGTRSIGVTIELANPKETLRAGQYAVARGRRWPTTPTA